MREFERFITGAAHLLDTDPNAGPGDVGWPTPSAPRKVALRVTDHYARQRTPLVFWAQQWFRWDGAAYRGLEDTEIRGDLYQMLQDAQFFDAKGNPVPWNPDRAKVDKVLHAMKMRRAARSGRAAPDMAQR